MTITSPLSSGPFLHSHDSRKPAPLMANPPSGSPSKSTDSSQKALQLFDQLLAKAYEKLGLKIDKTSVGASGPLTAEKVAGNILGFIERRLQMDRAEGATPEQLQARLDAGLSGFKKGFAEASEKLKALSMLSPAIAQDIGQTYTLVMEGIDRLQQQLISAVEASTVSLTAVTELQEQAATSLYSSSYQYARASNFSFELTTVEGDRVTISASNSLAYSADLGHAVPGDTRTENANLRMSLTANELASWSVEGDLNEQERAAIRNLLVQVDQLADQFFAGNLDQAFDQALALGYNTEQISAFSLKLTQVEVQRVSTAYQTFESMPAAGLNLSERLLPVGQFLQHLLESVDKASAFAQPEKLLLDMAGKIFLSDQQESDKPGTRFVDFIAKLLANNNDQ